MYGAKHYFKWQKPFLLVFVKTWRLHQSAKMHKNWFEIPKYNLFYVLIIVLCLKVIRHILFIVKVFQKPFLKQKYFSLISKITGKLDAMLHTKWIILWYFESVLMRFSRIMSSSFNENKQKWFLPFKMVFRSVHAFFFK
jgi:hypothetical protein